MKYLAAAAALLIPGAANAETFALRPLIDLRVRYEHVEQDGLSDDARAFTMRIRPGVSLSAGPWSVLAEAEATAAFVDDYNSGTNGRFDHPVVVDPQNVELNRVQMRYADGKGHTATLGRQVLELADQRFVGSSNFRQNQQTFDAARIQLGKANGPFADLTYAWSDRTVNGIHGQGARQQAVSGDNVFALAGYQSVPATLTVFAYLVDQDELAVQGFRLSSQTYGARMAGSVAIKGVGKVTYALSGARQSNYRRNPNDYFARYWLAEATLSGYRGFSIGTGYEVLGADEGLPLTSVQTPLASLFKFNGWADKFTTTPPNGLRDFYGSAGYSSKKFAPFDTFDITVTYHRFNSDRLDQRYGKELDLLASVKKKRLALSARLARYHASMFATDTTKIWLEADWAI